MKIRDGFTIIELMIAMAVLMVVVVYLTEMLTRQSRAYTVVDQVTEAQQNLRAIADTLDSLKQSDDPEVKKTLEALRERVATLADMAATFKAIDKKRSKVGPTYLLGWGFIGASTIVSGQHTIAAPCSKHFWLSAIRSSRIFCPLAISSLTHAGTFGWTEPSTGPSV